MPLFGFSASDLEAIRRAVAAAEAESAARPGAAASWRTTCAGGSPRVRTARTPPRIPAGTPARVPAKTAPGRRRRLNAAPAVALLLLAWPAAAAAKDVPYLSARVVDEAGLLSAAAKQKIEGELAALERETGDQVAVLVVASLGGEPLEEYSVKVAQTWKLGQKGKDNGILLLISRDDRKMRIEVGYGLEGQLKRVRF